MAAKPDFEIAEAADFLSQHGIAAVFLVPTAGGLHKSILDATYSVRAYLQEKGIHCYEGQKQGAEGKKTAPSFFVTQASLVSSTASLYRPVAKRKEGDPRIWFSKLRSYASANNLLAVLAHEGAIYLINLSNPLVLESLSDERSPLSELFRKTKHRKSPTPNELLQKFRTLAAGSWMKPVATGARAGATIEAL